MTLDVGFLGYRSTATFFPLGWPAATAHGKNLDQKDRSLATLARGWAEVTA